MEVAVALGKGSIEVWERERGSSSSSRAKKSPFFCCACRLFEGGSSIFTRLGGSNEHKSQSATCVWKVGRSTPAASVREHTHFPSTYALPGQEKRKIAHPRQRKPPSHTANHTSTAQQRPPIHARRKVRVSPPS